MKLIEWITVVAMFVLTILAAALLLERGELVSERNALKKEVQILQKDVVRWGSYAVEINKQRLACLAADTTKKFVRAFSIPGQDTMPVIVSCSLFNRSGQ